MNCAVFGKSVKFWKPQVYHVALIPLNMTPVVLYVSVMYKWQVLCVLLTYASAFINRQVTFIKLLKTKMKLKNVERFISYCAVNTVHLGYKNPIS
jgi:hypothetical protein